jgi:hypothetical protein
MPTLPYVLLNQPYDRLGKEKENDLSSIGLKRKRNGCIFVNNVTIRVGSYVRFAELRYSCKVKRTEGLHIHIPARARPGQNKS